MIAERSPTIVLSLRESSVPYRIVCPSAELEIDGANDNIDLPAGFQPESLIDVGQVIQDQPAPTNSHQPRKKR
jgi:hypothetical protein